MIPLLDTHTFVWAMRKPELLSAAAREAIDVRDVYLSSVSVYEIAAKVRLGKWNEAEPVLAYEPSYLAMHGFHFLDLTPVIALRAGKLIGEHRDPFDRMLAATAIEFGVPIISVDTQLDTFGVRRIW